MTICYVFQNVTYDPVDPATLNANMMTLNQLFTQLVAESRWTEDYSWLLDYDWMRVINDVSQRYQNKSLADR